MRKGKPWRDKDSTTYIATTERWEEYGRMARREFDRRFPLVPDKTIFLTDGGKWLRSVHDSFFPFATMILDIYHALEHLKGIMVRVGSWILVFGKRRAGEIATLRYIMKKQPQGLFSLRLFRFSKSFD